MMYYERSHRSSNTGHTTLLLAVVIPLQPTTYLMNLAAFMFLKGHRVSKLSMDAFKYLRGDCSHWFLTHFLMDHYQGLTRSFCHGNIYCSSITSRSFCNKIISEYEDWNTMGHLTCFTPRSKDHYFWYRSDVLRSKPLSGCSHNTL